MNFKQKMAASFVAGAVVLSALAPAVFADTNISIFGNGSGLSSSVSIRSNFANIVRQINNADINTHVNIVSETGSNSVSDNTGGDAHVSTGDAHTSVQIQNHANTNHLIIGPGNDSNENNNNSGKKLHTFLSDTEEVPGPGDPDGFGRAKVRINPEDGQLCVDMWVRNIAPATAAHIHEAPKGTAGPVVVTLPTPDAEGKASGCVSVDSNELKEIKENPTNYYVNVHNAEYPSGAIRGQL